MGPGFLPRLVGEGALLWDPPAEHGAPVQHNASVIVLAEVHCAETLTPSRVTAADPDSPAVLVGLHKASGWLVASDQPNCRRTGKHATQAMSPSI